MNKVAIMFVVLVLIVGTVIVTKEIKDRNDQRELEETFRAADFDIYMDSLRKVREEIEDRGLNETQRILKNIERKLDKD